MVAHWLFPMPRTARRPRRPLDERTRRSSRKTPRSGLTLIEVAVTITIMGIIVAVALPAMRDLSAGADAGPLEPLRALLVATSQDAAATGSAVELWMVPASGRYRIVRHEAGAEPEDGILALQGVRARGPADRFRVVFNPVGLGVGDTLAAGGVVLRVDAVGAVIVER